MHSSLHLVSLVFRFRFSGFAIEKKEENEDAKKPKPDGYLLRIQYKNHFDRLRSHLQGKISNE